MISKMKNRVVVYSKEYCGAMKIFRWRIFSLIWALYLFKDKPLSSGWTNPYSILRVNEIHGDGWGIRIGTIHPRFHPISPSVSLAHPSIWFLHPFSKTNGSIARVNLVAIFRDCCTFVSQMGCNFFVVCLDVFSYSNTFPHSNEFWRIYPPENQSSTSPKRGRAFLKTTFILDVIVSGLGFSVRVGF